MQRRPILLLLALGIGALLTAITATAAYFASRRGLDRLSEIIFWPNTALQALIPAPNMGTPEHLIYEGTPLNILAFFASFPAATLIYALIVYLFFRHRNA
jgi:hypothetical protein